MHLENLINIFELSQKLKLEGEIKKWDGLKKKQKPLAKSLPGKAVFYCSVQHPNQNTAIVLNEYMAQNTNITEPKSGLSSTALKNKPAPEVQGRAQVISSARACHGFDEKLKLSCLAC